MRRTGLSIQGYGSVGRAPQASRHLCIGTYLCATLVNVPDRNVTFKLPADLMRQAKVYAAEHDTTLNAMVRKLLQEKISAESRAKAAADQFLQLAANGPYSPVNPGSIPREDLYERR